MPEPTENPVYEVIKAMKRLKKRQKTLEKAIRTLAGEVGRNKARNANLEQAYQDACEHSEGGPFREFYERLKAAEDESGEQVGELDEADELDELDEAGEGDEDDEQESDPGTDSEDEANDSGEESLPG